MIKSVNIIGAGAVGMLFGAHLAESGVKTTLLGRSPETADAIHEHGIQVSGVSGHRAIRLNVTLSPGELPPADLVLMCVKAYDTRVAAEAVKSLAAKETPVLTLQNGLGNVETLCEIFGTENVLAGTTCQGANVLAPGRVHHAGAGRTVIGEAAGARKERTDAVADVFTKARIPAEVTDEALAEIWGKIIVNAGINAIAAVMDAVNGVIVENEHARRLSELAVMEAVEVARAEGAALPYTDAVEHVREVARATAENINSTLADVRAGKRTEIEMINRAVVSRARARGIDAPVNHALALLVDALDAPVRQEISAGE